MQLKAQIKAMQDRITDTVSERLMESLDERMIEFRYDLLGEVEDDLDTRWTLLGGI